MWWFSKKARTERTRQRFAEDDPHRYLFVLPSERKDDDPPVAFGPGGSLADEDLRWYLEHPDG